MNLQRIDDETVLYKAESLEDPPGPRPALLIRDGKWTRGYVDADGEFQPGEEGARERFTDPSSFWESALHDAHGTGYIELDRPDEPKPPEGATVADILHPEGGYSSNNGSGNEMSIADYSADALDGERIRELRDELDESQAEFAERIGSNQSSVAAWEGGRRTCSGPTAKLIRALEDEHLGVSIRIKSRYKDLGAEAGGLLEDAIRQVWPNSDIDYEWDFLDFEEVYEVDGEPSELLERIVHRVANHWDGSERGISLKRDIDRLAINDEPLTKDRRIVFWDEWRAAYARYLCQECGRPLSARERALTATPIKRHGAPAPRCSAHEPYATHRDDEDLRDPGEGAGRQWSLDHALRTLPSKLDMTQIESIEAVEGEVEKLGPATVTWLGESDMSGIWGQYLAVEVGGSTYIGSATPRAHETVKHLRELWNDYQSAAAALLEADPDELDWTLDETGNERVIEYDGMGLRAREQFDGLDWSIEVRREADGTEFWTTAALMKPHRVPGAPNDDE